MLSATQLDVFLRDETEYAQRYIVRVREGAQAHGDPGRLVHPRDMEQLFVWIKGGREVADIDLNGLLKYFDESGANKADGEYVRTRASPGGLHQGLQEYIKAKWDKLYPSTWAGPCFERGCSSPTDPKTNRTYSSRASGPRHDRGEHRGHPRLEVPL